MEADALLFQETNTDFKKIQPMNSFQQTMKLYHHTHATSISNSTVPAKNNNWLPGGTMSSVLGKWTGAKITSGNDYPLGRWSWISLKGRGNRIITLINVYRVNPGHSNLGEYTNFKQQVYIKLKEGNDTYNPRTQTILDLQELIQTKILQQEDIIMCIDANEIIEPNPTKNNLTITSLIQNQGLINLASTLPEQYESQKNGRLIDFCLITPSLLPSVHSFGYLPYNKITTSDHRNYFLDLQISDLFAHTPDKAFPIDTHKLVTRLPNRKDKYLHNLKKQFENLDLLHAAKKIQKEAKTQERWNQNLLKNMTK
jgi:hypothetical protein